MVRLIQFSCFGIIDNLVNKIQKLKMWVPLLHNLMNLAHVQQRKPEASRQNNPSPLRSLHRAAERR